MEREALVVGINKYPRLGDLDMPEADAKAIADILETYGGFKVTRLPEAPGERVCSERLEEEITRLFCPSGKHPPKTALFFFAGHGLLKRLGTATQSYLATSESDDARGIFGLSLMLLRDLLQDSPVKQQIVWLDCCFSGGFIDPKKADPGYAKGYDRCFIAACRDYEVAHGVGEHGVLTTALLAALNPERHPRVTTKTLVAFVTQELRKVALPQSPIHEYSGEEIILTNSGGDGSAKSGWLGIPPYKGLQYFDNNEQDSALFCGRQEMTRQLIDRVRKSNFLVVVGASGSGKSSVVRAGLLHELELGEQLSGSDRWLIVPPFTPSEHPIESLRQAIANSFAKEREEAIAAADASRVVLVVDQFEEAFTLCQDREERRQFFDCLLGNPVEEYSSAPLQIIIVMRSDFFDKLTEPESIRLADKINEDAVSNLFTVTSMRGSELEQAIREPAQKVGLQIEDSLVQQILEDLGVSEPDSVAREPGSLPLLEYTLDLLWQRRQDYDFENLLTLKGYENLKGVKGALKKRADEIFKNLTDEEKQAAERIFLELTHIGEGAEDTRRRLSKTKLKTKLASAQLPESLIDQVVQKLADEKLVVTSGDSAAESMVEVAHEALIRHWPRLRDWVDTNREAIRTERMIQVAAEEWRDAGKPEHDYLWGGVKLAAAESYSGSVPLSNLAQEFIQASQTIQDRVLREKETQSRINLARHLAAQSELLRNQQPHLLSQSVLLAVESMRRYHSLETDQALREGLKLLPRSLATMKHEGRVKAIAFSSPDGKYLATAGGDSTARIWETTSGQQLNCMRHETKDLSAVVLSPDRSYLVTVSSYNPFDPQQREEPGSTLWVWEVASETLIYSQKLPGVNVKDITLSPDGKFLVTVLNDQDGSAWIWQIVNGHLRRVTSIPHEDLVITVAFSSDGKCLAIAYPNQVTLKWQDGSEGVNHIEHEGIGAITFSPDGKYLATASTEDCTAKVWDVTSGQEIARMPHKDILWAVAFSPDGKYLATAGRSKIAHVWEASSGQEVARMIHKLTVYDVAFSPELHGKYLLATASDDQSAQVWELDSTPEVACMFHGSKDIQTVNNKIVWGAVFSPDGKYLATASEDATVRVWEWTTGQQVACLARDQPFKSVAFSPDGEYLATASKSNLAWIWKWKDDSEKPIMSMEHRCPIEDVAFSPNGDYVATASKDGSVKLWGFAPRNEVKDKDLPHEGEVESVAFSPDGELLTAGSWDGIILVWKVSTGELVKRWSHGISD